ncbi:5' nucleotidase, NT5C type [Erwinia psidii]|uniref:5'-3'-deoxyribonucleotidase n=1 Tax=Erwinia psidii TaxID=69224 RepID=A0A3N6SHQ3_9GAMM|nr:5'-3'-deoxyribonucleotidase [Erwinia psidii]MCX8957311.1 5'-3'-deoxyribonucleotidase [Erwinia psidii]MCX8959681.1 5'-3'-deoxyribonucleotidase [Erwinia psidii]MCX8964624.1 5'-3'-deoxyribonucleotidase [Erwinia psidii]RQM38261.1 5'-3'-deoxyribonucleotidase [Erwinia psidii]
MKRIAIDMDEVIADFHPKMVRTVNQHFNATFSDQDLNLFSLRQEKPEMTQRIMTLLHDPDFFADLDVISDSQAVITALSQRYEIFITTAAMEVPSAFNAKFQWLKQHFPAIEPANIVFCGNKSIINADYMIDDNAINFKDFCGEGILFSAPHNQQVTGYRRVENWQEVAGLLL